jgi:hypothetical protein
VVEQWAENPCVESSILSFGTLSVSALSLNLKMFFVRPRRQSFIGERRLQLQSSGFSVASSAMSLTYRRFRQALYLPILKGLRVRFKGKTIRAKRVLWRQYKFKVGLTHMSIRGLAFSALCRMLAKQRMVL